MTDADAADPRPRRPDAGLSRAAFEAFTLVLPRISALAGTAADLAASTPIDPGALAANLTGMCVYGLAALALGIHFFEHKDF